jgi:hypothetical protein
MGFDGFREFVQRVESIMQETHAPSPLTPLPRGERGTVARRSTVGAVRSVARRPLSAIDIWPDSRGPCQHHSLTPKVTPRPSRERGRG